MKKTFHIILSALTVLAIHTLDSRLMAQGGVAFAQGGLVTYPSSALEIPSSSRGVLLPRVSLTDVTVASPITSPANSLLVYNTNPNVLGGVGTGFYYWATGLGWIALESTGLSNPLYWSIKGNSGTNPATHFLGTTNDNDIVFKLEGIDYGRIGLRNTSLGDSSFGYFGFGGVDNTSLGNVSMVSLTNGTGNSALGPQIMGPVKTGNNNTGIGRQALYKHVSGNECVAIGLGSSDNNITGSYITSVGDVGSTDASYCTSVGYYSGGAYGYYGEFNTTAIGAYCLNDDSYTIQFGGGTVAPVGYSKEVRVGIGTSAPGATLDIKQSAGTTAGIRLTHYQGAHNWRIDVDNAADLNFYHNGVIKAYIEDLTGDYKVSSDIRVKKDIQSLGPVMPKLMQLQAKTYHYKTQSSSEPLVHGFLAQQVETLFPDLVCFNPDAGLKGLDYSGFGIIAIKAIQEQQQQIDARNKEIDELAKRLEALEKKYR
jgi:hypothetical protein